MSDRSQSDSFASQKCGRRRAAECGRGNCAGFTYIGLLILIAMMGFALTVVAEVWQTVQTRDKEEELLFVGNQFRRALAAYNANGGRYPHQLEDLLKDPAFPGVRRYLRQIYRDPITGSTEWGLLKPDGNSIVGVYSLSEAKPLKQAGFSLADESFEAKDKYSEWVFTGKGALGSPATLTPAPGQTPGISPAAPGAAQAFGAPAAAPAAQAAPATATPANSGTTSVDAGQDAAGRFGPRGRR